MTFRPIPVRRMLDAWLGRPLVRAVPRERQAPKPLSAIRKILLIKLAAAGDTVLLRPAIKALRAAYPEARIDWLVSNINRSLAVGFPEVDRTILFSGYSPPAMASVVH